MGRHDRDNVDHLNLPNPVTTTAIYYTETNEAIDREKYQTLRQPPVIVAKEVQHPQTKITDHFILIGSNNRMYDPRVNDARYKRRDLWKFRRVTRVAFDLYRKFLKAKYSSLLTQAERAL